MEWGGGGGVVGGVVGGSEGVGGGGGVRSHQNFFGPLFLDFLGLPLIGDIKIKNREIRTTSCALYSICMMCK